MDRLRPLSVALRVPVAVRDVRFHICGAPTIARGLGASLPLVDEEWRRFGRRVSRLLRFTHL